MFGLIDHPVQSSSEVSTHEIDVVGAGGVALERRHLRAR